MERHTDDVLQGFDEIRYVWNPEAVCKDRP